MTGLRFTVFTAFFHVDVLTISTLLETRKIMETFYFPNNEFVGYIPTICVFYCFWFLTLKMGRYFLVFIIRR